MTDPWQLTDEERDLIVDQWDGPDSPPFAAVESIKASAYRAGQADAAREVQKIADNTDRRMIDDANGNWWAYEPLQLREWLDEIKLGDDRE